VIRLAIRMLLGDRSKCFGVLFGIAVTTFLMTMLVSMFAGMLSRTYGLVADNPGVDVWVMDPACQSATQAINMPQTVVERVRGVEGVASATRLTVGAFAARMPHGAFVQVDVIGADDATLMGIPSSAGESALRLREPDTALLDLGGTRDQMVVPTDRSRWWSGQPGLLDVQTRAMEVGDEVVVNTTTLRIAGHITGTPRFQPQPVLYTTYTTASRMLPAQRNQLTYVLVRVAPGSNATRVAEQISSQTQLQALTSAEFKRRTVIWFFINSGVISQITVMITFAFAVGLAITGLMMNMFTTENSRFYAAFKAIGASHRTLLGMVTAQASYAAVMGYGIGLGICCMLGVALRDTGFPFRLMWYTPLITFVVVLFIATVTAMFSARSVLRIEPGAVFK
jgi:putative ABC transport system permease protein